MSEWSLECDVWESKFSENNSEPSIRHAYAAGWNRHKEIHSKSAQNKEEAPGTIDNTTKAEIKPNNLGVHHSSACGCRYCE